MNHKNQEVLLKNIIKSKPYIFWSAKDIESLNKESIVEAVLCKGEFNDFIELIKILGIKETAEIFFKQVSIKRTNYNKKTENYFTLFFERHLKDV